MFSTEYADGGVDAVSPVLLQTRCCQRQMVSPLMLTVFCGQFFNFTD